MRRAQPQFRRWEVTRLILTNYELMIKVMIKAMTKIVITVMFKEV